MKNIFILLITCVIVCISCSKGEVNKNDDVSTDENGIIIPNENGATTNKDGKKLVSKLIYDCIDNDKDDFEIIFSYDSKGNINATTRSSENEKYTTTMIRDGNKITYTSINLKNQEKKYQWWTLDDAGRIIKKDYTYEADTYSYNENGQLKMIVNPTVTTSFTWKNGNITSRNSFVRPNSQITKYNYYSYPNNINIDFTEKIWGSCEFTFLGKTNENLLKSVSTLSIEFEYEFENRNVSIAKKYITGKEKKLEGIYYFYYK